MPGRQFAFLGVPFGLEGVTLALDLFAQLHQAAPLLFEVVRELFFLPFEAAAPLLKPNLLLGQGGLLGDDGRGLDAQRLALLLQIGVGRTFGSGVGRSVGVRAAVGQFEDKLERADLDAVAVMEGARLHRLAIDERLTGSGEVAEDEAVRAVEKGTVERRDLLVVKANVAAGTVADEGERASQDAAGTDQPAVADDELAEDRGRNVVGLRRRGGGRIHPRLLRGRAIGHIPLSTGGDREVKFAGCAIYSPQWDTEEGKNRKPKSVPHRRYFRHALPCRDR